MDYAPERKRLNTEQLCELLVTDKPVAVMIDGVDVDADWLRTELEMQQSKKLMPRPTVDEPAYHEGSRNQRRVAKKLMHKAAKANKRR
jgi:hypothetical protein